MLGRNSLIMPEKQFLSKSIRNPILNRASAENSNGVVVEDCERREERISIVMRGNLYLDF